MKELPLSVKIALGMSLLPLLLWPVAIDRKPYAAGDTTSAIIMLMPVYAALTFYLAARSYGQRPHITWLLLAVLWLSYAAIALLIVM